jgi:hypothetical protein
LLVPDSRQQAVRTARQRVVSRRPVRCTRRYEWVRQQVYAAADLPFARLDLQDLLVDPGDLERLIRIDRPLRDGAAADLNRQLVNDHLTRLKEWIPLAFFDL